MPLYDFECSACGAVFEELIFDENEKPPCQKCHSSETARKMAAPSPLKTNPFPYPYKSKDGKPRPVMPNMSHLNKTCPNAHSCGATASFGGNKAD